MAPTTATSDFRVRGSCGTTMQLIERDLNEAAGDDGRHEYLGVFHVGDLSYAAGQTFVWDHFGALIEPTAKRVPYMVSVGNHDFGYLEGRRGPHAALRSPLHKIFEADGTHGQDAAGECGVPSEARFRMPENGRGLWWYSVDVGLTHHVVLSSEHDVSAGSPMRRWLQQDLASVDRARTPWLLVHIHRPLYCSVAFGGDFTRTAWTSS
ncbi:hypothetical protein P43SY_011790 [Pythium insidiosum]|uniref:Calcineurin-like phosphoesterase domain-containing protein n=1 Tax=Pythium insidiosum TaxID=114742 RepID=A0AAD5Q487_PYTIN|nr:hypothetical protein P43SY_011790 [Pythium insidiosum]